MSQINLDNQLPLAGICQAAALVQSIARTGQAETTAFEASISSILVTDPENTQQVFGSLSNVRIGLTTLINQLNDKTRNKDAEITRYVASLLSLERKLIRDPKSMTQLGERISHVQRQLDHVDFENTQILTNLASIYTDVVSNLGPKIQIAGNPTHLKQDINQKRVRALLLAGIRSAVLWRQLGGKRRIILFKRKQILSVAQNALRQT